jgi:hypothetical protein
MNQSLVTTREAANIPIPPELERIAAGRDFIQTKEFAHAISRSSQTIRKNYCLTGEAYGIRPVKIGNLLWPVVGIAELLNKGLAA